MKDNDWKAWKVLWFFYAHINTAFGFYMYGPLQVVSCDQ